MNLSVLAQTQEYRLDLMQVPENTLPTGWVVAATNPSGPFARWQVKQDSTANNTQKVFVIDQILDRSPAVFNVCWTRQLAFLDGVIQVRLRANAGQIDQGGGVIWRVIDSNNYYVARYNPLEKNFRLYFVKEGRRKQLASHDVGYQARGSWIHLRVAHDGNRIQGWINNVPAWSIQDDTFSGAGGVGLWSKADAATAFAEFVVRHVKSKGS